MKWTKSKPKLLKPCLLLTATYIIYGWEYTVFQILWINEDGHKSYLGICDYEGCEWGDYSDLKADKYLIMDLIK